MEIESLCPFPVATVLWEPRPGQPSLTVCVKATYTLLHGRTAEIAGKQLLPCGDIPWGQSPSGSLYAPSDFAPRKPRVDVTIVGHAYAPGGAPIEGLIARAKVCGASKALRITGDRAWVASPDGLRPGPITQFTAMPLVYERAPRSASNPIGMEASHQRAQAGWPLPNITLADATDVSAPRESDRERTPGFGPVPAAIRARARRLRDDAARWAAHVGKASGPAPEGFDYAFFNVAPPDQQLDALPSNLSITLENMSPTRPLLETRLPVIQPRAFRVSSRTGLSYEVALRCDTVWIDCDQGIAVMSWRGAARVPTSDEGGLGKLVITTDKHPEPLLPSLTRADAPVTGTRSLGAVETAPAGSTLSVAQSLLRSPVARALPAGWVSSPDERRAPRPDLAAASGERRSSLPSAPTMTPLNAEPRSGEDMASATIPIGTKLTLPSSPLPFAPSKAPPTKPIK